jgi:cytochrome oxidase Cu insertion factor (SCO1/SenC/PrrC family)
MVRREQTGFTQVTSFPFSKIFGLITLAAAALVALAAGLSLYDRNEGFVSSGRALVGGPFELVAHTGQRVSDRDFRGKYMLVTFGYTYCPDVCPAELQVISSALDQLGEKAREIQPLFITIDPERDDVKALSQYMPHFHPQFLGLTGSPEAIDKAAKAYRVYYAKAKDSGAKDYLMDHSSIIYLMDKGGTFLKHFSYQTDAKALAKAIEDAITQL